MVSFLISFFVLNLLSLLTLCSDDCAEPAKIVRKDTFDAFSLLDRLQNYFEGESVNYVGLNTLTIGLRKKFFIMKQEWNGKRALFPFPPTCKFLHVNLLTTLSDCYENSHTD